MRARSSSHRGRTPREIVVGRTSPKLTVVAGANGAGKSTYSAYLRQSGEDIIDPDALARHRSLSAVGAGRAALVMAQERLSGGLGFGVETTLAGEGPLRLMRLARSRSYEIELAYLGTDNVEINLQRIVARVAHGGHHVDEVDVRRRYTRSLARLPFALALADRYVLIDNTERLSFDVFVEKDDFGTASTGRFRTGREASISLDTRRSRHGNAHAIRKQPRPTAVKRSARQNSQALTGRSGEKPRSSSKALR